MKHNSHEHDEQVVLFQWAALAAKQHPELSLMFAIPNGGKRNIVVAKKMKAEGLRAGIPDIFLPAPRYHRGEPVYGLFIELKVGRNKPTQLQVEMITALRQQGYRVEVCYGFEEARDAILSHLEEKPYMPRTMQFA